MIPGPILARELRRMATPGRLYWGRLIQGVLALVLLASNAGIWSYGEWDRTSRDGTHRFALSCFGILIAYTYFILFTSIPSSVALRLTEERERKTLDVVMTSRMTAMQIVAGYVFAGLAAPFQILFLLLPVYVILIPGGGVDPRLIGLMYLAFGSLSVMFAGIALASAIGARTSRQAISRASLVNTLWLTGPLIAFLVFPKVWPTASTWMMPVVTFLFDSTPFSPVLAWIGFYRGSNMIGALLQMIALQSAIGALLLAWTTWRLRAACRAVYDTEGWRFLRRSRLRARKRPACRNDPVLWKEIHTTREHVGPIRRVFDRGLLISSVTVAVIIIGRFAWPAFQELWSRGYTAPSDFSMFNVAYPVERLLSWNRVLFRPDGIARLEFNFMIRHALMSLGILLPIGLMISSATCIPSEIVRETWLGLLATPLTEREILRGFMLGCVWRFRWWLGLVILAMTTGLIVGAVHPAGFLLALADLAAGCWLFNAVGMYHGLRFQKSERATARPMLLAFFNLVVFGGIMALPPRFSTVGLGALVCPLHFEFSLLSVDDFSDLWTLSACRSLKFMAIHTHEPAWRMVLTSLIGLTIEVATAWWVTRLVIRNFDRYVGRPARDVFPGPSQRAVTIPATSPRG